MNTIYTLPKSTLFLFTALAAMIAVIGYLLMRVIVQRIVQHTMSNSTVFESCDINHDGVCDFSDIAHIHESIGACAGDSLYEVGFDIDGDGCITATGDFEELLAQYYTKVDTALIPTETVRLYDPSCDMDGDRDCDNADIGLYVHRLTEKTNRAALLAAIDSYSYNYKYYPADIDDIVPDFVEAVPELAEMRYEQLKGGRAFQLCHKTYEDTRPHRTCIEQELN